jgi:hypothetical protein
MEIDMETQKLDLRFGVITIIGGMALFGAAYYIEFSLRKVPRLRAVPVS